VTHRTPNFKLDGLGEHIFASDGEIVFRLRCIKCGKIVYKVRNSEGKIELWSYDSLTCVEGQIKDIIE